MIPENTFTCTHGPVNRAVGLDALKDAGGRISVWVPRQDLLHGVQYGNGLMWDEGWERRRCVTGFKIFDQPSIHSGYNWLWKEVNLSNIYHWDQMTSIFSPFLLHKRSIGGRVEAERRLVKLLKLQTQGGRDKCKWLLSCQVKYMFLAYYWTTEVDFNTKRECGTLNL